MGLIPYLGGKHLLAKQIVSMMPAHVCYAEVFAGGASVFFRKEPSKAEVLNDINNELITLYRVVKNHKDEFLKQFDFEIVSREEFKRFLNTPANVLTDIQKAARYFYLQKLAFGGKIVGRSYGCVTERSRINFNSIDKTLNAVRQRLLNVSLENLPYDELITRYDKLHTLFYIDPPYHGVEDYYGKNLFSEKDYYTLNDILKGIKGKFIMSINDTSLIREIFKTYIIKEVPVNYSVNVGKQMKTSELIITNF